MLTVEEKCWHFKMGDKLIELNANNVGLLHLQDRVNAPFANSLMCLWLAVTNVCYIQRIHRYKQNFCRFTTNVIL